MFVFLQIAFQKARLQVIAGEIDDLDRKLQEAHKERQSVTEDINERSSLLEATCGIWDNECDPVEKIIFVEQLSESIHGLVVGIGMYIITLSPLSAPLRLNTSAISDTCNSITHGYLMNLITSCKTSCQKRCTCM